MMLLSWKKHRFGLLLLLTTWMIFFSRTLFLQQVYFLDDLKIIYYPLEYAYSAFQQAWALPLWSSAFGFGQPLLGWGQLGFFTPLHLLLRAASTHPLTLLQISIVTYYAAGLVGMYWFFSKLRLAPLPAAVGAIIYVFCGFHIGHLNHVNFYTSSMVLPYLLAALAYFIEQPTLRRSLSVAAAAAVIAVSGQPQIVIFCFFIGGLVAIAAITQHPAARARSRTFWIKLASGTILAGALALALSSLATLPLIEFLPQTERAEALPDFELLDFSYVPWHAITLLFPYFYGDHTTYWGAKGFQELAAFVGIIPLFLAGVALSAWRRQRALRLSGALLIAIGIIMALGRYSFFYTFLVEHKTITGLGVASRFVFMFDVGIALLAAAGLHDLITLRSSTSRQRLLLLSSGLLFPVVLVSPFIWYLSYDVRSAARFMAIPLSQAGQWWALIAGLLSFLLVIAFSRQERPEKWPQWVLGIIVSATFILSGWNYNPLTPAALAYKAPFAQVLQQYQREHGYGARLYSANQLLVARTPAGIIKQTDAISSAFSIHQPITVLNNELSCLRAPVSSSASGTGKVFISLSKTIGSDPLRQIILSASDISSDSPLTACFEPIADSQGQTYILNITSNGFSNLRFFVEPNGNPATQIFWVRKKQPTPEQVAASQKPYRLILDQEYPPIVDQDAALLSRHLNVIADASSARWIGALSIRPYREFIEDFLANDKEAVDGDGRHVIERFRSLVNLVGITHLTQIVPAGSVDMMAQAGYVLKQTFVMGDQEARLYENPQAFPKVFMMRQAIFMPSPDDVRARLHSKNFNPAASLTIDGPNPPPIPTPTLEPLQSSAVIVSYAPTRVAITTNANQDAFVVLNDAYSPQWQTTIDGKGVDTLIADSFMRAAYVPAGQHHVVFTYYSPAVAKAKIAASVGLVVMLVLLVWPKRFYWKSKVSSSVAS